MKTAAFNKIYYNNANTQTEVFRSAGCQPPRSPRSPRQAGAFTIAELIVAIGVTVILILGVSRIFSMSRKTISIGQATAEVSQQGRVFERMMRQDLNAIARGEGFLVIRNERLGKEAKSAENHRDNIYLNAEQRELANSLSGNVRLDQLVFFAYGNFPTYQYGGGSNIIARNDTAPVAKIWYGHGYRKPGFFNSDPDNRDPQDWIIKDPGPNGYAVRYADDNSNPDTANMYAQDWVLARQAALLAPREFSNNQLKYAPSFIEYFNEELGAQFSYPLSTYDYNANVDPTHLDKFRLSSGYVDLIDADISTINKAVTEYGTRYNYTSGEMARVQDYFGGYWYDDAREQAPVDSWVTHKLIRDAIGDEVAETWAAQQRLRMMFATGRMRVETAAISTDREDQMLTHATMIPGCTDFQVAWSTGQVDPSDASVVWYDIENPANPYYHTGIRDMSTKDAFDQAPAKPKIWYLSEMTRYQLPGGALYEDQGDDLYYATFGNFVPKEITGTDPDGDRSEKWPWPTMLRIRARIYDHNANLPEGRQFEFIISLPEDKSAM